jgi:hypothetical protein
MHRLMHRLILHERFMLVANLQVIRQRISHGLASSGYQLLGMLIILRTSPRHPRKRIIPTRPLAVQMAELHSFLTRCQDAGDAFLLWCKLGSV